MKKTVIAVLLGILALLALVMFLNLRGESDIHDAPPPASPAGNAVARGAYLVRVGNCMGCHTERGGAAFAGGRAIDTPFGTIYSTNLTPHRTTGLGEWTPSDFWRALHHGRARDGSLLYPAFPYPDYTHVTRADADAMHAYLRTLPAIDRTNTAHRLRWPYSTQAALAVWRALYFAPGAPPQDTARSAEWNRGAYLVRGLGHCGACHSPRNALGATSDMMDLSGGVIPMQNWYAPSLSSPAEAGVADWELPQIEALLRTGVAVRGTVLGPMAEVVLQSTQYLSPPDLRAMSVFLKSLPQASTGTAPAATARVAPAVAERGARLYGERCAQCHGERGQGIAGAYPALAGNRAVNLGVTANLVQVVLNGGFAPATQGHPRPFGMPPFALVLSDADVAALLSYVRSAWGNQAGPVDELTVSRQRGGTGS